MCPHDVVQLPYRTPPVMSFSFCKIFSLLFMIYSQFIFTSSPQVYKYREHIFFLQQKFKQEQGGLGSPGLGPPSSPLFEDTVNQPPLLSGANKLYGSSAPQYINKQVLHGPVPPKYPLMPMSEKKQGSGRHGDGQAGKPWQYQQVSEPFKSIYQLKLCLTIYHY